MKRQLIVAATLLIALVSCETPQAIFEQAETMYAAKDYNAAVTLYRRAADRGNTKARLMLGKCYDFGYGVKRDLKEAVRWYTLAAEAGDVDAQNNLAGC